MAQSGYTPILIYASGTTGNTPSASNLTSSASGAELALNYFDGKLFYKDSTGTVQVLATKGTAVVGGSNTQVQYNNNGVLAGSANMTFDGTNLSVSGSITSTISGKTAQFNAAGGSIYSAYNDGTTNWRIGTGIQSAGVFSLYNSTGSINAFNVTSAGQFQTNLDASIHGLTVGLGGGSLSGNTAFGVSALSNSNSGTGYNTAIGANSMQINTTGNNNTAVGINTLVVNTTGGVNTAIGAFSLQGNTTGINNTALGVNSLFNNTTAGQNTAVGVQALSSNTTASNNTAVGYQAGYSNTTGTQNAYFGYSAGYWVTGTNNCAFGFQTLSASGAGGVAGSSNSAFGTASLFSNTTGNNNAVFGTTSLYVNTTGSNNTAIGSNSSQSNTTGSNNTAIGYQSLISNTTASNNTAVGYQAAYSNTTGAIITAIGRVALYSNTTGGSNTALGNASMYFNTTGGNNTALGELALYSNTTASNNTAVGYQAGYSNTTANYMVAVGYQAGYANTTQNYNTFIGYQAGLNFVGTSGQNTCIGATAGYALTTGHGNTFVGGGDASVNASGNQITTGSQNTILGNFSGNQGGLDIRTASNYIVLSDGAGNLGAYWNGGQWNFKPANTGTAHVISWAATGGTAQYYQVNGSNVGSIACGTTTTTYNITSDRRLKSDIAPLTDSGTVIDALQPRTFTWNVDGSKAMGFITDEFQQVFPNAITGQPDAVDEKGEPVYQQGDFSTSEFMAVLVAEIQSLRKRIATLESK